MIYKGSIVKGSGGGSGDAVWGSITGTLSNQTDLQSALNAKLENTATGQDSYTIGGSSTDTDSSINIGSGSRAQEDYATAIGGGAYGDGEYGTAIGYNAEASGTNATAFGANAIASNTGSIQIGAGTNSVSNTLNIGLNGENYELLDANGYIPSARINIDDETINENAQNKLQAVGVVNQNTASGATTPLKFWEGTESEWTNGVATTWYNWKSNPSVDENAMPDSNNWGHVAYGDGKFITVAGFVYTDAIAISADDGETWTSSSLPTGHNTRWNTIAYGDGNFVALGYNSDAGAYSSDGGATWTDVTLPATERWVTLAYGDGRFVALDQTGHKSIYSTDGGVTWSSGGNYQGNTLQRVMTYGNGVFVTIAGIEGQDVSTSYSSDGGLTWTAGTMPTARVWMSVTFGNGKFIAVAKGTEHYAYSSDGITWTEGTLPSSRDWMSVTFGNGLFVAVTDGGKYAYSSDGVNWTEDSFTGTGWKSIAYGNGKFVAITLNTHLAAQITINPNTYFTLEAEPTTESTVYSAPDVTSALTITSVDTGTISLSDNNTYAYSPSGNVITYQTIGEAYPNYICFIEGVGVKMGTTSIVTVDQTYNASSTNAQSGVAVDSVVGTIETALSEV